MKRHFIFIFSIFLVGFILFYTISIYFGNNPLNNTLNSKYRMISILPEGWAFFTKNSTDPRLYLYKVEKNKLSEINLRNFSSEYFWGLSRNNRIFNLELANVFKKVSNDSSVKYVFNAIDVSKLAGSINKPDTCNFNNVLIRKKIAPNIKGKYLMIVQLMLPWSLLHLQPQYPSRFIVYPVNVCHNE